MSGVSAQCGTLQTSKPNVKLFFGTSILPIQTHQISFWSAFQCLQVDAEVLVGLMEWCAAEVSVAEVVAI